jgi:hypothetical protein
MGEVLNIESLFNTSWIPETKKGFSTYVFLALYAPFGTILFLLRSFIALQFILLAFFMPQSKLKQKSLRIMSGVLGLTFSTEGEILGRIFISNRVTRLDHYVIYLATSAVTPMNLGLPSFVQKPLAITDDVEKEELLSSSTPLVLFPEVESTNGERGLLQFQTTEFLEATTAALTIQPVGLKASRILLNVNYVQGGLCSEIFFTLFLPNTHFVLKFLPPESWNPVTAQDSIAQSLNLVPTKFGVSDKAEYIKKLNFRPPSLATMARAVQQQLSPVILSPETIISTLQRTGSVARTVEELRKSLAEPSFRKSASERMTSFQERKRVMILTARKKYLEKHGIEESKSEDL